MAKTGKKSIKGYAKSIAKGENAQYLAVVCAIAFILVIALSSAVYYRYKFVQSSNVNAADYYGYKTWSPNEIVVSRDIAFSFNGARTDRTTVPGFWELESGSKYVIVDVSFKNSTNKPYQLSPILSMKLTDESGKDYSVTSSPAITKGLGGQVAPGDTMSGEVGFTVPDSAKKFTFVFEPYVASSAPISVAFTVE